MSINWKRIDWDKVDKINKGIDFEEEGSLLDFVFRVAHSVKNNSHKDGSLYYFSWGQIFKAHLPPKEGYYLCYFEENEKEQYDVCSYNEEPDGFVFLDSVYAPCRPSHWAWLEKPNE